MANMNAVSPTEFWRRAWLLELGVDWRGALPRVAAVTEPALASVTPPVLTQEPEVEPPAIAVQADLGPPALMSLPTEPSPHRWQLLGQWRWSWWKAKPGSAGLPQALLLRPVDLPRASDAAAREVLAAALAAVSLAPEPKSAERSVGGVLADGQLNHETLLSLLAGRPWREGDIPTVILCLPATQENLLATALAAPDALPGAHWTLVGEPTARLVLLPAPERLLEGAAVKRVAWQALAPLRVR